MENLSKLLVNITKNQWENLLANDISNITSTIEKHLTNGAVQNDKVTCYWFTSMHAWLALYPVLSHVFQCTATGIGLGTRICMAKVGYKK